MDSGEVHLSQERSPVHVIVPDRDSAPPPALASPILHVAVIDALSNHLEAIALIMRPSRLYVPRVIVKAHARRELTHQARERSRLQALPTVDNAAIEADDEQRPDVDADGHVSALLRASAGRATLRAAAATLDEHQPGGGAANEDAGLLGMDVAPLRALVAAVAPALPGKTAAPGRAAAGPPSSRSPPSRPPTPPPAHP